MKKSVCSAVSLEAEEPLHSKQRTSHDSLLEELKKACGEGIEVSDIKGKKVNTNWSSSSMLQPNRNKGPTMDSEKPQGKRSINTKSKVVIEKVDERHGGVHY